MVNKAQGRYIPMWDEVIGTLKIFFIIWIVAAIFITIFMGASNWALYGAVFFGFIIALCLTLTLALVTGARHS